MTGWLDSAGWGDASAQALAGDASARRYTRLTRGGDTAILMEDPGGDTVRFVRLARWLRARGLSAPDILAEDHATGRLLLEDFGDALVARQADSPEREAMLYRLATDALVALHAHAPPQDLPTATPERLAAMTDLAFTHYAGRPDAAGPAADALRPLLASHATPADVMVLRDYHAENILHLPGRAGPEAAGLLDFQDALTGHRAYDLASLLRDARRDLFAGTAETCIRHYLTATGCDEAAFRAALAVLGVQRNLRILGVFARLATEHGKPRYLALLPRVWAHLQADLQHPALAPLRPVLDGLPDPATARARLERSCPTA